MSQKDKIVLFEKELAGLAHKFWVNPNSCGNHEHYENYIRYSALGDRDRGVGTTWAYIRTEDSEDKLLGYITFRASSYIKSIEGVTHGYPALEISELAVSKDVEGNDIGTKLVKFAFSIATTLNDNFIGIQYIVLCADKQAVGFYEKMKFLPIGERGEIPHEDWNVNCVPMIIKLEEKKIDVNY